MAAEQAQAQDSPPDGARPDSGQLVDTNPVQQPTLGRIVFFRHDLYSEENSTAPAIITGVSEDWNTVDLTVFFKNQVPYPVQGIAYGPEQGQWLWPPRV
jgi:hypothetical protein